MFLKRWGDREELVGYFFPSSYLYSVALPSEHSLHVSISSPKVSTCKYQPITKYWVTTIFMALFDILFSMMLAWFLFSMIFGNVLLTAWLVTAFNFQSLMFFACKMGSTTLCQTQRHKRWWKLSWWILIHLRNWQGFTEKRTLIAHTTPSVQLAYMSLKWPFKECFKCQCFFRKHWIKHENCLRKILQSPSKGSHMSSFVFLFLLWSVELFNKT